jgi:uncharacterized repeat protein (TIGR03803 family)
MITVRRTIAISGVLLAVSACIPFDIAQAAKPVFRTIYNFSGPDGQFPLSALIMGPGGVLYGTTQHGGLYDNGAVFSLTPPASSGGTWTEAVIHSFARTDTANGLFPLDSLAIDSGGALYGTTSSGGVACAAERLGCGTVFRMTPPAAPGGAWGFETLYSFKGGATDGNEPVAGVAIGGDGTLYGTTDGGGCFDCGGTVFSLTPPATPGGAWTESLLYVSSGAVLAPVMIGSGGVLYGATLDGGASNDGSIFSLAPLAVSGGAWTESLPYSFSENGNGLGPRRRLGDRRGRSALRHYV